MQQIFFFWLKKEKIAKITMVKKKRHGADAVCSVLLKYLHPAKYIDEKFKNSTKLDRLQNCIAYRQEVKTVKRKISLLF